LDVFCFDELDAGLGLRNSDKFILALWKMRISWNINGERKSRGRYGARSETIDSLKPCDGNYLSQWKSAEIALFWKDCLFIGWEGWMAER
jgi:hypothetical protein